MVLRWSSEAKKSLAEEGEVLLLFEKEWGFSLRFLDEGKCDVLVVDLLLPCIFWWKRKFWVSARARAFFHFQVILLSGVSMVPNEGSAGDVRLKYVWMC